MTPEQVRELRQRLGLSQEQMAHRLGTSLQTVHRWESGKSKPSQLAERAFSDLEREARDGG